jgi:two-component system OmpR family response regulator
MTQHNFESAPSGHMLLVEDDDEMADSLAERLLDEGWNVRRTGDGESGMKIAADFAFDVLVIDRMLPGLDGLSLVHQLRARGVHTPVLFLSALGSVADRVAGLESGGDDYLVKPFAFAELNARVNILARRRKHETATTILRAGDVVLNRLTRSVSRGNEEIMLLPLEFRLLELLMMNTGRIVTRKMLLEDVWGFHFDPRTNIVETHISHLRRKIQDRMTLITTVRGAGYMINSAIKSESEFTR